MTHVIFLALFWVTDCLHCMDQSINQFKHRLINSLQKDYTKSFSPVVKNNLMYFYKYAEDNSYNVDPTIPIFKRIAAHKNAFFYAPIFENKLNQGESIAKSVMQAKTNLYTLFITPHVNWQGQVFLFLIEILRTNPLVFQHPDYKDVRILDIVFNVKVDIQQDFSKILETPRFIIDIVNVFPVHKYIGFYQYKKRAFDYNYTRTRDYACQLAIFLIKALQKKFNLKSKDKKNNITLQKAFQLHPWVWVSQTYYAQDDDANNFNARYNNAFFKPNVTGVNESYAITSNDLEITVKNTLLYELKEKKTTIYNKTDLFKFILEQNTLSKNYHGRIIFDQKYNEKNFNEEEKKCIFNMLTNNYFILLTPTVENSQLIIKLLNQYKTENPVIYQENGANVCFNDIVFNIIKFSDQVTTIGIVINNIADDPINNFKDINTIINVERTKEYTEKLLLFLHNSFEEHTCLSLPNGMVERFNILSGVAHIKDLFFVTQRSPLIRTELKKEYFDEQHNYAYFKSDITNKSKEYTIDQSLFKNAEDVGKYTTIINDAKRQMNQSFGDSNRQLLDNEPPIKTKSFFQQLFSYLKIHFVFLYNFFAWLFF